MNNIDQITYRGFNINIHQDVDPPNPRTEFGNAGRMICFHRRYTLGDEHQYDVDTFQRDLAIEACPGIDNLIEYWESGNGWNIAEGKHHSMSDAAEYVEEMTSKAIQSALDRFYYILPLYLYDHSGITMSTSPFSCPWDSGQVGVILITKEQAKKEWDTKDGCIQYLIGEVEIYDQYLTGAVYGYTIEPTDANKGVECDDSCWGFYGHDHKASGLLEMAKEAIDCAISDYKEKTVEHHRSEKARKQGITKLFNCCWAY